MSSVVVKKLRIREPEAVELQGLRVVVRILHHSADGRTSPVSDFKLGAVGKGEWLQRLAASAHYSK